MKTLKIMGYIFAVLITVIIIAVWLLIFPYSLEEIEIVGFKYIVPFLFKIFFSMRIFIKFEQSSSAIANDNEIFLIVQLNFISSFIPSNATWVSQNDFVYQISDNSKLSISTSKEWRCRPIISSPVYMSRNKATECRKS